MYTLFCFSDSLETYISPDEEIKIELQTNAELFAGKVDYRDSK